MLTFNKHYVFANSTETDCEATNRTRSKQEAEQEQIRQNLLLAVRQTGGINEE